MAEKGTFGRTKALPRITRRRVANDPRENALLESIGIADHLIGIYDDPDHPAANLFRCTAKKAVSRKKVDMGNEQKTIIVTGASQGMGAGVVQAFLDRGYNVVANSRNITKSAAFKESAQ